MNIKKNTYILLVALVLGSCSSQNTDKILTPAITTTPEADAGNPNLKSESEDVNKFSIPNESCQAARISKVEFIGDGPKEFLKGAPSLLERYKKWGNFCQHSQESLPIEIQTLLNQFSKINFDIAKKLGVSINVLLEEPMQITLAGDIMGSASSQTNEKGIRLGLFSTWSANKSQKYNSRTYIHEFTHFILLSKTKAIPTSLKSMVENPFIQEGIPDLFSQVIRPINENEENLGACLANIGRPLTNFQSYDYPIQYFQKFSPKRFKKCCDQIKKSPNLLSIESEMFCSSNYVGNEAHLENRDKIKPTDSYKSLKLNVHQMGIPFASFLIDLAEKTNQDPLSLLLEASKLIDQNTNYKDNLFCSMKEFGSWKPESFNHQIPTMRSFFEALKIVAGEKSEKVFNSVAERHAIGLGEKLSQTYAKERLAATATSNVSRTISKMIQYKKSDITDSLNNSKCLLNISETSEPSYIYIQDRENSECVYSCVMK